MKKKFLQFIDIENEELKIKKECKQLQERLDNLSIYKKSTEFHKLPYDIKQLAKENIFDEERYLKDKKNKNFNKLSNLHLDKIDLLLKLMEKNR